MESPYKNTFYYFPPWRRQFFFSTSLVDADKSINYIYSPYNRKLKIIWSLWKKSYYLRQLLFKCSCKKLPPIFHQISQIIGSENHQYQINTGTPGPEQKFTMLVSGQNGQNIFVKAGISEKSIDLIKNENDILAYLSEKFYVPKVIDHFFSNGVQILLTEAINGKKYEGSNLTDEILAYLFSINKLSIENRDMFIYCFSHGDFCPWNIIYRNNSQICLIDWELSGMYPLGFDLIVFIFRTSFLLNPKKNIYTLLNENISIIQYYYQVFGIDDFKRYLNLIAINQSCYASDKGSVLLINNWEKLAKITENL